jgi:hypothetical protein
MTPLGPTLGAANDRQRQLPANMKLARTSNPRATHGNALVMRRSLDGDEDQGDEVPAVVRDRRRRARCVPDQPVYLASEVSQRHAKVHWAYYIIL